MYAISVNTEKIVTIDGQPWIQASQLPTFYLDENVQGITSESHAESIARQILDARTGETLHITAVKL